MLVWWLAISWLVCCLAVWWVLLIKGCGLWLFGCMGVWLGCSVCFDLVVWVYGFGVAAYLCLEVFWFC